MCGQSLGCGRVCLVRGELDLSIYFFLGVSTDYGLTCSLMPGSIDIVLYVAVASLVVLA